MRTKTKRKTKSVVCTESDSNDMTVEITGCVRSGAVSVYSHKPSYEIGDTWLCPTCCVQLDVFNIFVGNSDLQAVT